MGGMLSAFWRFFGYKEEVKVVMVGLNAAGKTTALYRLVLGTVVDTQPTIGNNVESLRVHNLELQVWDLGGQSTLRQSWATYYTDSRAIIFVVDSSDSVRFEEAKAELWRILKDPIVGTAHPCILVLANKQDKKEAVSVADLSALLGLTNLRGHAWTVVPCCALTGKGLSDGMEWIANHLDAKKRSTE